MKKIPKNDMRDIEYGDGYTATLNVETLEFISEMPGFGEVGYRFVIFFSRRV